MTNHSHKKAKAPSPTVADVDAHASVTVTETAAPEPALELASSKKNPLVGMSDADLEADVDGFLARYELQAFETAFRKGALLARAEAEGKSMTATTTMMTRYEHQQLSDAESEALVAEHKKPMRSIPSTMWLLCALCAGCAIVQGMDQTVINGAQVRHIYTCTTHPRKPFSSVASLCRMVLIMRPHGFRNFTLPSSASQTAS